MLGSAGTTSPNPVVAELCHRQQIYSVYIAPNEEMVREHARRGGFPANSVSEIRTTIDPTTAEG